MSQQKEKRKVDFKCALLQHSGVCIIIKLDDKASRLLRIDTIVVLK